ncbi:MAG: AAA family ATPase [Phototrophicaceae bacterium]
MTAQHPAEVPRALALVGMAGAGKSVLAEYLAAKGFYKLRFGQIVVDEVARRGLPLNPHNEQLVRESLRDIGGMNAIADLALPYLQNALQVHQTIVIDGLYGFGEYKLLRANLGAPMVVICVTCDRPLRYNRLTNRAERPLTLAEAEERDIREIELMEKGGPIALADYTLINNTSPADLLTQLETVLATLGIVPPIHNDQIN